MTQALMNAVLLTGFGGPEKLVYTQVPKPIPQSGEVLVKIGACSINNTDLNTRTGWYTAKENFQAILQDSNEKEVDTSTAWGQSSIQFPRIQGADIVGNIIEIADDVKSTLLNQRVMVDPCILPSDPKQEYQYVGSELDGGFAEYASVPVSNVYPIHASLSDVELATFPCAYSTAENMLVKGRISATDTVLITGASGGVGSALIQLSKIRNATVIAIVGKHKQAFAKELGADYVYCREESLVDKLEQHQITLGLDVVGSQYFSLIMKALEVGGRYVSCGAIGHPLVDLDLRDLIYKDLQMNGATRLEPETFPNLVRYIEQGLLKPLVAKVFHLSEIHEAQQFFQSKRFFGKVVLTPQQR